MDFRKLWNNDFIKSGFLGAITALSFAPFNIFPIFLATFAWLFVRICEAKDTKRLLAESFFFFFFLHVACLYWIAYPLTFDLSKHWMLIPLAVTLIPACLSLYLSLFPHIFAYSLVTPHYCFFGFLSTLLLLAIVFCYAILPGHQWLLPGYIWCCHEVFLQTLSLYGVYGLSAVTLAISICLAAAYLCRKKNDNNKAILWASISVGLFLFIVLFGCYRLISNPIKFTNKKIRIVQCNIPQEKKNDRRFTYSNLMEHLEKSRHESKVDFVVWPEASVPYLYKENFDQLHDYLKSPLNGGEYLLTGVVRKDLSTGKIYNSVVVINHNGENVANYDKSNLLPFGEYVPFRKYLPFQSIASDIGDFDEGERATDVTEINGVKIAFTICYEISFPDKVVPYTYVKVKKRWWRKGSKYKNERIHKPVDLIVNVTNDGWFGLTTEPFQHLQIARARAIENGVPLVRATNFGISAVFDAYGREIARVPINTAGVIEVNIPEKASD